MSKLEVNAVEPQCGTNLTLGASGDTIIIPSGATISNQGTAAGFGPTGAVSWNTTKITANPNPAVTGVGYFADTTSAAFTITLPATPAAGAVVGIADYANTFATNNITVDRNGSKIGGATKNSTLFTNGIAVTFVYVDSTQGWIVTDSGNRSDLPTPQFVAATGGTVCTSGDYKIHTFTGPGTFTVSNAGNTLGSNSVDYLVVAGGGAGGTNIGGGGGAGGFRESVPSPAAWTASPLANPGGALPVTVTGYPITVGSGGAGGVKGGTPNSGNPSIFSSITSTGGGFGSTHPASPGANGGSGGGGSYSPTCFGSGNTPPVSPPQGNNGGAGVGNPSPTAYAGGGGGGATVAGSTGTAPTGGPGGNGATTSISGSPTTYAGGGGGSGSVNNNQPGGTGGSGGGGNGTRNSPFVAGTNGGTNLGGGGGGRPNGCTCAGPGTNGGSGIVVIRYKFQ
jgi:hypothetical protein